MLWPANAIHVSFPTKNFKKMLQSLDSRRPRHTHTDLHTDCTQTQNNETEEAKEILGKRQALAWLARR